MFYEYYNIIDEGGVYVGEVIFDDLLSNNAKLKVYALEPYYVQNDGKVVYPVVFATKIEDINLTFDNFGNYEIIENAIKNRTDYDCLPIYNPHFQKINYKDKPYNEISIIDEILSDAAYICVYGNYDIEQNKDSNWIVRRNGQEIFNFDPKEFLKIYEPDYDGADVDCYMGDAIVVKYLPDYLFGTDRNATNLLCYKLNFMGKLYCIEHGCKPSKDDRI